MMSVPAEISPIFKDCKVEYNKLKPMDEVKQTMSKLTEFLYPYFDQYGITNTLSEMMVYISDFKGPVRPGDDASYEDRTKKILTQLLCFFMEYASDRIEVLYFFKSCYLSFDI